MQEGGTVDPVSGNDVPPGAMQEEVRDDIDAKLSEGEFVFPADVVRYIGLETLMRLRDKAKTGLKKMEEIGQMGNAEEVPNGEALHGEGEMDEESFSSEIDSIMGEEGEREYAEGGYVGGTENQQLYGNVPLKGFEMVAMTNDEGQVIYIPFINGVPQLTIPQGYKVKSATPTTPKPTTPAPTTGAKSESSGGDSASPANAGNSAGRVSINEQGEFVANTTNPLIGQVVGGLFGKALLGPLGGLVFGQLGKAAVNRENFAAEQEAMFGNVAIKDSNSDINGAPTDAPTATTGKGGTGGAAASAAATAASAATAAGHSPAAVGAAAQAAADAVVSGKSPAQAAQIAAEIAAQVTSDIAATAAGGTTGPSSAAGVGVGSTTGINSMDAMSDAASRNNTPSETSRSLGSNTSSTDTSPSTPSDTNPSGPSGFGSDYGDTSMGGSSSFDSAYSYAQGGFVSKKKTTKASKPTSLVARRK